MHICIVFAYPFVFSVYSKTDGASDFPAGDPFSARFGLIRAFGPLQAPFPGAGNRNRKVLVKG